MSRCRCMSRHEQEALIEAVGLHDETRVCRATCAYRMHAVAPFGLVIVYLYYTMFRTGPWMRQKARQGLRKLGLECADLYGGEVLPVDGGVEGYKVTATLRAGSGRPLLGGLRPLGPYQRLDSAASAACNAHSQVLYVAHANHT
jgi:hypothetical protein